MLDFCGKHNITAVVSAITLAASLAIIPLAYSPSEGDIGTDTDDQQQPQGHDEPSEDDPQMRTLSKTKNYF